MQRRQHGFTLIELMVVVAIVGLLVSIAFPQYQVYIGRSKWGAAMHEVMSGKLPIETSLNDGISPTLASIGMMASTSNCASKVDGSVGGENSIECTIVGGPGGVKGETIRIVRRTNGKWECSTSAEQKYVGADSSLCTGV